MQVAPLASGYSACGYKPASGRTFDGNGNVIGLVDMATGVKSATYDYNAFGETIQSDGVASVANHFRFSTKYTDDETGLLYYGYRFYQPTTGRWLSRDPIEERGGMNIYGMVGNDQVNWWDFLGMGIPGDPMDPNTALAEAALFENPAVMQQAAREGAQMLAREAAARAAAAAAAAAAASSLGGDSCPSCSNSNNPAPAPAPAPTIGPIPQNQYQDYKKQNQEKNRICKEPPPSNLTGCDLLRWKLDRMKRCLRARQDMLKWPFQDQATMDAHLREIANMNQGIRNLEELIRLNCPCPATPPKQTP